MASEWEVVGKQKKPRKQTGGDKKTQSQNASESAPKIEDTVDMDEICSLYTDVKDDLLAKFNGLKDANGKADPKKTVPVNGKRTETPVREQQQGGGNKSNQKEPEPAKQTAPSKPTYRNLDAALRAISAPDLHSQLTAVNVSFKDNHLMLLKALTGILNDKLRVDETDPLYTNKPASYPYKSIPQSLRDVIDDCIAKANEENGKYFYDLTLSNLASDMNKGLPYLGHKLVLQAIAVHYPAACVNNLARNAILRNSYQNRTNIGLNLLWALGQGGYNDLDVGLKVWQDIMVPVMELKNYNRFTCDYVQRILKLHRSHRLNLGGSEFLTILSSLTTQPKAYRELDEAAQLLVERYVFSAPKASATFAMLFKNISFITRPEMIYYGLALCLLEDPESASVWLGLYRNNVETSLAILSYLNTANQKFCSKLLGEDHFIRFLSDVEKLNEDLLQSKKKTEGLKSVTSILKEIQGKSKKKQSSKANSKSSSSVTSVLCSFLLATFLLFGVTGALIGYDTYRAGGKFEASFTGQTLKQAGLLPAVQDAWTCTMKYSARGYKWAEANVPVYYQATSKALGPYVEFSIDFGKVLWNGTKKGFANAKLLVEQKLPVVADFIEQYAPGLPKKIGDASCAFCDTVCTFASNAYKHTYEFFKTQVFVGKLSMESLGKAFNSTQQAAALYYSWFNDQVDFYAKLK
ncbi:transmembrane protein 214-A [Anopheles marshallii]|uniref:transmembrane protein 214-A n=1 Tax=Anopheles marshallii TaxID=1521116 RepID=UPI00237AFF80|nr:transmembrane protein 214-A [Anopheles marshallii]